MDRKLGINLIWNTLGNVIYLFSQWVITLFTARYFGYEEAGVLSLAMTITSVIQTISLFGIRNYQTSDINEKYEKSCYIMTRNITCVAALIICMAFAFVNKYSAEKTEAIFWFMLFRLAENYSDVFHGIIQNAGRLDIAGKLLAAKGAAISAAFFGSVYINNSLGTGLMFMAASSWICTLCADVTVIRKRCPSRMVHALPDCFRLLRETVIICISLFLSTSIAGVPRYILEKMVDGTTYGAYSSIFAPAFLLYTLIVYMYTPFIGAITASYSKKDTKALCGLLLKVMGLITALSAAVFAAAAVLGDFVLELLLGKAILEYTGCLLPALAASFTVGIMMFSCTLIVIIRDNRNLIIGNLLGIIFAVLFTAALIKMSGANGASYGMLCSSLVIVMYNAVIVYLKMLRPQNAS